MSRNFISRDRKKEMRSKENLLKNQTYLQLVKFLQSFIVKIIKRIISTLTSPNAQNFRTQDKKKH